MSRVGHPTVAVLGDRSQGLEEVRFQARGRRSARPRSLRPLTHLRGVGEVEYDVPRGPGAHTERVEGSSPSPLDLPLQPTRDVIH